MAEEAEAVVAPVELEELEELVAKVVTVVTMVLVVLPVDLEHKVYFQTIVEDVVETTIRNMLEVIGKVIMLVMVVITFRHLISKIPVEVNMETVTIMVITGLHLDLLLVQLV